MMFPIFGLSLLAFTAAALPRDIEHSHGKNDCPEGVRIITSRGHSTDNTTTWESLGLLQSLLNDVEDNIMDTSPQRLHYPNAKPNIVDGVNIGTPKLTKKITDFLDKCPDAQIILLGYSEGAMITMNTLCGTTSDGFEPTDPLPKKYAKNIIATVVYGDLTRPKKAQPYDQGTCKVEGTRARKDPSQCGPFMDNMHSYCDFNDPYCCEGGDDIDVHHGYAKKYNTDATDFVVSKWKKAQNGKGKGN